MAAILFRPQCVNQFLAWRWKSGTHIVYYTIWDHPKVGNIAATSRIWHSILIGSAKIPAKLNIQHDRELLLLLSGVPVLVPRKTQ